MEDPNHTPRVAAFGAQAEADMARELGLIADFRRLLSAGDSEAAAELDALEVRMRERHDRIRAEYASAEVTPSRCAPSARRGCRRASRRKRPRRLLRSRPCSLISTRSIACAATLRGPGRRRRSTRELRRSSRASWNCSTPPRWRSLMLWTDRRSSWPQPREGFSPLTPLRAVESPNSDAGISESIVREDHHDTHLPRPAVPDMTRLLAYGEVVVAAGFGTQPSPLVGEFHKVRASRPSGEPVIDLLF